MVKAPTLLKLRRAWQAGAVRSLIAPYGYRQIRATSSPPPLAAELGFTRVRPLYELAEVGNIRLRLEG